MIYPGTDNPQSDANRSEDEVATAQQLHDLAARRVPQPRPYDGACMVIAPLLTADLLEHGYAAATEKVWGWLDDECRLLGFGHLVTVIDGRLVVDATATLYSDSLPAPWVCALDDYTEALARASGMRRVIIGSLTRPENGE